MRGTEVRVPGFNLGNVVTEETWGIKKKRMPGKGGKVLQIKTDNKKNDL